MRRAVTISLSEELERRLGELADQQKTSRSDIVREALRSHFARRELADLRARIAPYAQAVGWLTDEDVFAEIS